MIQTCSLANQIKAVRIKYENNVFITEEFPDVIVTIFTQYKRGKITDFYSQYSLLSRLTQIDVIYKNI